VNGDQLETDDCIVTSWQRSMFLDTDGENSRSNQFLLHLNCNNSLASPGNPGYSLSSEVGAKARKDQEAATNIKEHPEYCERSDDNMQWCEGVCERTGMCEV
jgi:hypothetical protein